MKTKGKKKNRGSKVEIQTVLTVRRKMRVTRRRCLSMSTQTIDSRLMLWSMRTSGASDEDRNGPETRWEKGARQPSWHLRAGCDDHGLEWSAGKLTTTVRMGKKRSGVLFCCIPRFDRHDLRRADTRSRPKRKSKNTRLAKTAPASRIMRKDGPPRSLGGI